MFVIDRLSCFLSPSTPHPLSLDMPSKKKNYVRKSTGGKAPRKELFDKRPAAIGAASATINVDMLPALPEHVPATQVSIISRSCVSC
jgi:hypothetical protein